MDSSIAGAILATCIPPARYEGSPALFPPTLLLWLSRITKGLCAFAATVAVAGCTHSVEERIAHGMQRAHAHGWVPHTLQSGDFELAVFTPRMPAPTATVTIYIEGDGLAWRGRSTPSRNPTPSTPTGLELALAHGAGAAYLARPCQYVGEDTQPCDDLRWWTSHRFARPVIDATQHAIDAIKAMYQAQRVVLVGYSGGGAVAALAAIGRQDVAGIVTVAGNLDTQAWTELHRVHALTGSLNPADHWADLQHIPQQHFVGSEDRIMPAAIAQSYAQRFPADRRPPITIIEGYDHACCWATQWQTIMARNHW